MKNRKLFDPVRKVWAEALPEEIVRQKLLLQMIELGFPENLIAVEKEIDLLPHCRAERKTDRRADIIVFSRGINRDYPLYPLLLIECKAEEFSDNVLRQVRGYNERVKAPFIGIANGKKFRIYWQEEKGQGFHDFLPTYEELKNAVTCDV